MNLAFDFRTRIAIPLLCIATASSAQSPVDADVAAVTGTVQAFHQALASGNAEGAASLLAPDAVVLEAGKAESRDDYLAHHLQADIDFAAAVPSKRGKPTVTVSGGVAWSSSTSVTRGSYQSKPLNLIGAELMVLSRTSSGWEIRAIHWSSGRGR